MPLKQIRESWETDYDVVEEYASLSKETMPPIVIDPYSEVIDGAHRFEAAHMRKDEGIWAYKAIARTDEIKKTPSICKNFIREVPKKEVEELLYDSFFSEGHYGYYELGDLEKEEVVDREWVLCEINIFSLLKPEAKEYLIEWLGEEEDEWGAFESYDEPIIVGPLWAFSLYEDYFNYQYTILDGYHRTADAIRKGKDTILAHVGVLDIEEY